MARALDSRGGRRGWALLAVVAILAGVLGWATPSSANLPSSPFDAGDGNLVVNDEDKDWANAPNLSTGIEVHTGALDNSFGQGSKEDTAVPVVVEGSIPPNKSDLTRLYAGFETAASKTFLYLAWERVQEPSGTTNMDFELNQSSTLSGNGVTPLRTAGDVLIKYDLSQGGTVPGMGYHRWITTGSANDCEASNKLPCWDAVHPIDNANFEASINSVPVVDPIAPNAPRTLDPRTFGEAAVNLTDTGILPTTGPCAGFASAYLKSRSSDSFTAALKDFIAPIPVPINNCEPATINVTKRDGTTAGPLLADATLALYNDTTNNDQYDASGPNADTLVTALATGSDDNPCGPTTTTDATCTWVVTGNATSNYIIHETDVPTGYQAAPDIHFDVTFSSSVQTFTYTMVDPRAPRDLKIRKTDDDSDAIGVGGATFVLYKDNATAGTFDAADTLVIGKTCNTPTSGADLGNCTITAVDTGFSYWVVESVRPAGYSADPGASTCTIANVAYSCRLVSVPVGSGDIGPIGLTFVNPREFLVITFVCQESTSKLYESTVTLESLPTGGKNTLSTSTMPQSLKDKGVTEADLCALPRAQFPDLNTGVYDSEITISQ